MLDAGALYQAALERQEREREQRARRSLMAFIPHVSKAYRSPTHLGPYVDMLERARTSRVRGVVSTPPRHGKSETSLHYCVQSLLVDPTDTIAYVTYGADFSQQQGYKAAVIAERAGLKLSTKKAAFWQTSAGGYIDWNSIGGQLTGKGFKKLLVDDPVKDREEADSATWRDKTWNWFTDTALTRVEPGGSVIVIQTRWHPDDLAGRIIASGGWERINLRAIDDDGKALWPERWPVEALEEHRAEPYKWASLYQGEPRPRGAAVFKEPTFVDELPTSGYRVSIGADFAYTSKTYADYSVAVVLLAREEYEIGRGNVTRYYVADIVRRQVEAPLFRSTLVELRAKWPGSTVTAYIGGTEKGVVDFLRSDGLRIDALPALTDKFARAQPFAAAWNSGDVRIPRKAAWVNALVDELASFTGVNDRHDDQVDALAGAFAPFAGPSKRRVEHTNYAFG